MMAAQLVTTLSSAMFLPFAAVSERVQSMLRPPELGERLERRALAEANADLIRTVQKLQEAEALNRRLLDKLQAQAAYFERLALEDPLTGVANRRALDLQLARDWERAVRTGRTLSVV